MAKKYSIEISSQEADKTYEGLKKCDDPLDDLLDAYGLLQLHRGSTFEDPKKLNIDLNNMLVTRIQSNPIYRANPDKFKPIREMLDIMPNITIE